MQENINARTYQRRIISRPRVGATATVRQVSEVRLARLLVQQPSLIVVQRGTKTVSQDHRQIMASAGEAVFLREGRFDVVNQPDEKGLYEAFWLAWTTDSLERFRAPPGEVKAQSMSVLSDMHPAMLETVGRAHLATCNPDLPNLVALHRMEEALCWLTHCGIDIAPAVDGGLASRTCALIATDPGYAWTLRDIAERLVVSTATLRRTLAASGTGFSELLIDTRMSTALSLLQSTDRPVEHIASDVGYGSPSRFSVRFRARFGFAPSAIRGHRRAGRL